MHRNGRSSLFGITSRKRKPRKTGLTQVLDKGLSIAEIESMLEVSASYVDIVKLGWATSVVVENLDAKLDAYRRADIDVCCGGSLFELAVVKKQIPEYIAFLKDHGFEHVEVSDGVIELSRSEKLRYIERLARHFTVFSEVGRKDRTNVVAPARWVKDIKEELGAGSWKVICEGRESGTVGIYQGTGEVKAGLIQEIEAQIDSGRVIFEAPQKHQQVWLVKHFGPNVNLGNVPPRDVISVETIRQGLRADTLLLMHAPGPAAQPSRRRQESSRAHGRH
jgi:phosphosulfolactate synthase